MSISAIFIGDYDEPRNRVILFPVATLTAKILRGSHRESLKFAFKKDSKWAACNVRLNCDKLRPAWLWVLANTFSAKESISWPSRRQQNVARNVLGFCRWRWWKSASCDSQITRKARESSGLAFQRIRGWLWITFDFQSCWAQARNSLNGQNHCFGAEMMKKIDVTGDVNAELLQSC